MPNPTCFLKNILTHLNGKVISLKFTKNKIKDMPLFIRFWNSFIFLFNNVLVVLDDATNSFKTIAMYEDQAVVENGKD